MANYYGDSKVLRRSIFSTAGSFPNLLLSLLFCFPCFFPFQGIPCDFECFSLLSQTFWGFRKNNKSLLVWWLRFLKIRAGPTMTTTIFEFISRGPIFHFWGTPGWRTKCPFYTVERCKPFFGQVWLWLCLGRPWTKARFKRRSGCGSVFGAKGSWTTSHWKRERPCKCQRRQWSMGGRACS